MKFTLIVPALADVVSEHPDCSTPELDKWLARADQHTSTNVCYEQSLLHSLGRFSDDLAALPAAQSTFLIDFSETAPVHCARADPVHLLAERDDARLLPVQQANLTPAQAGDICQHLNAHFVDDGVSFAIGCHGRWYICGVDDTGLGALPTAQMAGRAISQFFTPQAQSTRWRQIATEVQMLLHSLDVNEQRSAQGLSPINALWFWGNGKIDTVRAPDDVRLFADDAFACGLGNLMGMTVFPLQEIMAEINIPAAKMIRSDASCTHTIYLDTRLLHALLSADENMQTDTLLELERDVFPRIRKMLIHGRIESANLDICDGRAFQVTRRALLRVWKKSTTLQPRPPLSEAMQ